jgi:hypothetical protein
MEPMRRSFLRSMCGVTLGLTLGLTLSSGAAAADESDGQPLVLALYAPSAPLPSADARFALVDKLAQKLTAAGVPAQGKVFARAADLEAAIKRGQVDLAVLDPLWVADRGMGYPVLAVATSAGEAQLRWGLYTHLPSGNILDMQNKALAWVSPVSVGTTKEKDAAYVANVLLYGELKATYFSLRPSAPDLAAAVSEVALRRADCVFAPEQAVQGKSLRKVYDAGEGGRIPNPVLVQVSAKVPEATLQTVKRIVSGYSATGVLDGWKLGGADAVRALRNRMRGRAERSLVMAEPTRLYTPVNSGMIASPPLSPLQPSLRSLLAAPEGIP